MTGWENRLVMRGYTPSLPLAVAIAVAVVVAVAVAVTVTVAVSHPPCHVV